MVNITKILSKIKVLVIFVFFFVNFFIVWLNFNFIMFVSFSKPNKSIVSYVSNGNPLIQWLDCSLEVVKLHNLNCRLILTLASFQRGRNFKPGEVGGVITIHCYEFLKANKSVQH